MSRSEPKDIHRLPDSRLTRFVASVLRIFYRRKVIGKENIDTSEASVFICNHGRASGPISAVLYLPVRFRPWINGCMLEREEATEVMMGTFRDKFTFLGPKTKRRLLHGVSRLVCHLLNSFDPVPVYKGDPRKSVETVIRSVEALERGENLLIFPEKPADRYDEESYKEFHTGFAVLGRAYHKHTGRRLRFYPVFSDSRTRRMVIGEPVTFDPSGEPRTEKLRISSELQTRMTGLKSLCHR